MMVIRCSSTTRQARFSTQDVVHVEQEPEKSQLDLCAFTLTFIAILRPAD
jgi:hypothetical protein